MLTWRQQLDWLLKLSRYEVTRTVNGKTVTEYPWRPYVKGRALELEADRTGLWAGIWQTLQSELEE